MVIIIVLLVLGLILIAMLAIAKMLHNHELSLGIQQTAQYLIPLFVVLLQADKWSKK